MSARKWKVEAAGVEVPAVFTTYSLGYPTKAAATQAAIRLRKTAIFPPRRFRVAEMTPEDYVALAELEEQ